VRDPNVRIVHEWLTNLAGSEKVVGALRRCFPGSPVHTSMCWRPAFPDWEPVITSWLQPLARGPSAHIRALPAMPPAFRTMRLSPADVTITSFHTFALWARVPPDHPHLVYCHTPQRFLWSPEQLSGEGGGLGRLVRRVAAAPLRRLDRRHAGAPTAFVANSRAVAARISAAYGRPADVVYPPVEVARFAAATGRPRGDYFLVLSRLVPYKRVDLAVDAFSELGWPLVVAGTGRERAALQSRAGPGVRFVGRVDDRDLPGLLAGARALVFPGEEDFGLVPVEAMAAGTPVVALARGGALETVRPGLSGILFDAPQPTALADAVRRAAALEWDAAAISASVDRFSEARFASEIHERVDALRSA
jgi:glycosyltransferase involved in cell wall biosynthesis